MIFFILSAPTIALSISVLISDNVNTNRLPLRPSMEDVSAIQQKQSVICPIRYRRPLSSEDMN